jgi:hypothetical protein
MPLFMDEDAEARNAFCLVEAPPDGIFDVVEGS